MSPLFDRLLVFAPHPDDEILGAGGTINRVLSEGGVVEVCYVSVLSDAHIGELDDGLSCLAPPGHEDSCTAIMLYHWDADEKIEFIPTSELIPAIENEINTFRPTAVMMPSESAHHQDHQMVARAVFAACRPSGGTGRYRPPKVLVYEEPGDGWTLRDPARVGGLVVQLEDVHITSKCCAMDAHVSQRREFPSERSSEVIRSLALLRGGQAGVHFAEVFQVLRWVV